MKANELRIGNYVTCGKENHIVSHVHHDDTIRVCKDKESERYFSFYNLDVFKPIPLTEEWIFKICRNKFYIKDRWEVEIQGELFEFFVNDIDNTFHIEFTGGEGVSFSKPIKYLHQLQNIYFALTNKELEIKM